MTLPSWGVGEGSTLYNGLYGMAPPKRGSFFRLQVYERVGISQVKNIKGEGNMSFLSVKRPKRLTDAFYGCKEVQKTLRFCDLFIFKQQLNGLQSSKLGV